jgi:tetratricopeptide (TPR) repeat protein
MILGFLFTVVLLNYSVALRAQTLASGGSVSPFSLGESARALGMGGANTALSGEGDSFIDNPASLGTLNQQEIITFHAPLFLDTIYDSIGYTQPVAAHSSFGFSLARLGTDNILKTVNNIQAVSTFSSTQWQGQVGYGLDVYEGLDLGASVKYVLQQMDSYQGSGMGADLGALYRFARNQADYSQLGYRNILLGFSAINLLKPQTKLFQNADDPIQILKPAVGYRYQFSSKSSLWVTAEGELPEIGNKTIRAGAEYDWQNTLFGRAGFDGTNPTLGAGLRFSGFQFDYAFNQSDFGTLHRFSLTYRFGSYQDPLQAQRIDLLKWVARSYSRTNDFGAAIQSWKTVQKEFPDDPEAERSIQSLQEARRQEVQKQLNEIHRQMENGNLAQALPLLGQVMSLDPGNPEAKSLLKQVDRKMLVSNNYIRGVEAYDREDYATAVEFLKTVYETDPEYRQVKYFYNDAQSHYLPLESMSKDLTDLYAKGVDFYMKGQYQQAISVWEKVLDRNPKNYLVQRNLEEARDRLKDKPTENSKTKNDDGNKKKQ